MTGSRLPALRTPEHLPKLVSLALRKSPCGAPSAWKASGLQYRRSDGWVMDGWVMDGWVGDGWVSGWMDGWVGGWMDGLVKKRWMDGE